MQIIPCSSQYISKEEAQNHDQSQSSSSSNYSLSPQLSLPSIPSLSSPPSQHSSTNHQCLATLKGHSSYVFSLALSGKHLYSGSSDSEIRIWRCDMHIREHHEHPLNPPHEHPLNPPLMHIQQQSPTNNIAAQGSSAAKCIIIMGDKLFSAHQDHKVRVFKINDSTPNENLKCISTLPTINDRWGKLFWGKNYVNERRNKKYTWVHHVDTVSSLALSQDGCLLYSASWDRTFKIWRVSDFKCMESVQDAHDDAINAIVVSFDGYVYTGSADRKIKVWKIFEGEKRHALIATLEKHKSGVNALALSNDGLVLYSGACDRSILVWEKESGSGGGGGGGHMVVVGALRGHNKAILCLVAVADLVVSGSADATLRIWRRGVGRSYGCLGVLEGHAKPVKCLASVVDSCYGEERDGFGGGNYYLVCSGSLDCDIKVWRIWVASQ